MIRQINHDTDDIKPMIRQINHETDDKFLDYNDISIIINKLNNKILESIERQIQQNQNNNNYGDHNNINQLEANQRLIDSYLNQLQKIKIYNISEYNIIDNITNDYLLILIKISKYLNNFPILYNDIYLRYRALKTVTKLYCKISHCINILIDISDKKISSYDWLQKIQILLYDISKKNNIINYWSSPLGRVVDSTNDQPLGGVVDSTNDHPGGGGEEDSINDGSSIEPFQILTDYNIQPVNIPSNFIKNISNLDIMKRFDIYLKTIHTLVSIWNPTYLSLPIMYNIKCISKYISKYDEKYILNIDKYIMNNIINNIYIIENILYEFNNNILPIDISNIINLLYCIIAYKIRYIMRYHYIDNDIDIKKTVNGYDEKITVNKTLHNICNILFIDLSNRPPRACRIYDPHILKNSVEKLKISYNCIKYIYPDIYNEYYKKINKLLLYLIKGINKFSIDRIPKNKDIIDITENVTDISNYKTAETDISTHETAETEDIKKMKLYPWMDMVNREKNNNITNNELLKYLKYDNIKIILLYNKNIINFDIIYKNNKKKIYIYNLFPEDYMYPIININTDFLLAKKYNKKYYFIHPQPMMELFYLDFERKNINQSEDAIFIGINFWDIYYKYPNEITNKISDIINEAVTKE
eukprot:GHVL01043787.1.p1 GENE.GHVL01043787.1~~GHVL01043787.1.p1  ORF type:complete len:694 (+),score=299.22 GHVL01043787.1:151-2082(+)